MGRYLNIGNEGFRIPRNGEYVDKSELIEVINSGFDTERGAADKLCGRGGLMGINYDKETKMHECKIEITQKQ